MRIDVIIRHYIQNSREKKRAELKWFAVQPDLAAAIRQAAFAEDDDGKRLPHQRRIKHEAMAAFQMALVDASTELGEIHEFHLLLEFLGGIGESIPGIGELYVYDLALHLGAQLGLSPQRVYLHRGTRQGAKKLGLQFRKKWLDADELPEALRELPAYEVEDILCIYKNEFVS